MVDKQSIEGNDIHSGVYQFISVSLQELKDWTNAIIDDPKLIVDQISEILPYMAKVTCCLMFIFLNVSVFFLE